MPTVFVSYSSADRREALAVRRNLVARGCRVWLDVFDIRVSEDVKSELGDGVAAADVLCLLLSPTAVASPWVAEEIARGEEQIKRGLRMIAVLLRPCRPPDTLRGKVMLDATAGIDSPDVEARVARAVLGQGSVGDTEIDAAFQESLQIRQEQLEAALVLPELAQKLTPVREIPIRKIQLSFRQEALPRGMALAVSLEFDRLFSQPMWFLFAHYREGHTWPTVMPFEELDHTDVRPDGKRVDGRFQWFDRVTPLKAQLDGTELRDLAATFDLELSGESWTPGGAISSYEGGPTVPHLAQKLEIPALATLVAKQARFNASLIAPDSGAGPPVVAEENDLDIQIVAIYESGECVTLYRSAHTPLERALLKGAYLSGRATNVEREAVLGLYTPAAELASTEYQDRRRAEHALLEKPEEQLSPDERRVVARLRHGEAVLQMFRVFGSAPPPGPARQKLHQAAIGECRAVWRLLEPLTSARTDFDEVGMSYWAASSLAHYYAKGGAPDRALAYAEAALSLVRRAAAEDREEPEYRRWIASALERVAGAQAELRDRDAAMGSLTEGVETLRALCDELPNAGRRRDLQKSVAAAIQATEKWGVETPQGWRAMLETD
jgi:hypothetical protein